MAERRGVLRPFFSFWVYLFFRHRGEQAVTLNFDFGDNESLGIEKIRRF